MCDNDIVMTESGNEQCDDQKGCNGNENEEESNIDANCTSNPLFCASIVKDYYAMAIVFEREPRYRVTYKCLDLQTDIDSTIRRKLVDWLTNIHSQFRLLPETFYLAIWIIDKYLERQKITLDKLQVVGLTALMISAKIEEIHPPEIFDYIYISDSKTLVIKDLMQMEAVICSQLGWLFTPPTLLLFLRRFAKVAGCNFKSYPLIKYLAEICLLELDHLYGQYCLSELVAACIWLARRMIAPPPNEAIWTPMLSKYTGYSEEYIRPIVWSLNHQLNIYYKNGSAAVGSSSSPNLMLSQNKVTNTFRKYALDNVYNVSTLKPLENDELFDQDCIK